MRKIIVLFIALGVITFSVFANWDNTQPAATDTLATSAPLIKANFQAIDGTSGTPPTSLAVGTSIVIEGATADAYETTITVTDPTVDRTWTLPNTSDTFVGTTSTQTLTNKTLTSPTINGGISSIDVNGGTIDNITSLTVANDVDIGNYELRAQTLESDVATGTAPMTIASTTKVSNLNADLLDGYDSSDLLISSIKDYGSSTTTGTAKNQSDLKIRYGYQSIVNNGSAQITGLGFTGTNTYQVAISINTSDNIYGKAYALRNTGDAFTLYNKTGLTETINWIAIGI